MKGALGVESVSGSSVRGTWWGDYVTGDPGRNVEKGSRDGHLLRGPAGERGIGLVYRGR